ncbi:MAG: class I SAM-dependent methyltransferase [Deltaproteobacteria bacterium]|nr:class I SAM-dependent methyltransferase [Deltaproteobacteria bacterium]
MSKLKIFDKIVALVIPSLQRLLWADKETLEKIQRDGVNIVPCNFYSSTPSIEEIENSYEYTSDKPPYFNARIFEKDLFRQTLDQISEFSIEFNPPVDGDEENCKGFFWENDQFIYSDAMSYYCFVRFLKPANIIEIGAGFSTLVALEAIEKNQTGSIHCIEPFPRKFLINDNRIFLHSVKAQEINPQFLNDTLQDGDILFIDSTHTVKSGSDCLHIYLRLLPEIRRNIFVHVHDVFLPFGLPKEWLLKRQIFWTEQYLLFAFLIDNPKARLVYGSIFNSTWNQELMEAFMGGKYPIGGGSVWFRYNGNTNAHSL